MKHRGRYVVAMAIAAGSLALGLPQAAIAQEASISVAAPGQADVGAEVRVEATLTSGGTGVAGAPLELQYRAGLGGVSGFVTVADAVTDSNGLATFEYQQRAAANGEMRIVYVGDQQLNVAPATFTITVAPGGSQLHRSRAGVSIPFLNGTVVIGVIMFVWAVIVYAAIQLVRIGREATEGSGRRPWVARLLAGVAAVTAVGMVIVFARTPLTHANLDTPEGYDRTPIARVDETIPFHGIGLADPGSAGSGDALWVGSGCASCHGLRAQGGTIGPSLGDVSSFNDFVEDVRRGPKGMPSYATEVLTDDELRDIYDWIAADATN